MTVKPRTARPAKRKAPVVRLTPTIDKPLNANCSQVVRKLKKAFTTAQSGTTEGALIIALDKDGGWTVDLAGQLSHDDATLCLITCRMLGACLVSK